MCIIHICSDNMQMICTHTDEMWTMSRCDMQRKPSTQIISQIIYMILKWNNSTFLPQIPSNNKFPSQLKIVQAHGDHEEWCRLLADDVRMMCACADDMQMMYPPADNMRMTSRQHMSSTSPNLQWSLTLVSSACHPCIVHMSSMHRRHETSVPRLFQVKQQRTALLKTKSRFSIR